MAPTIAALFDNPVPAREALQALMASGLSGRRTALIGGESRGTEMGSFQVSSAPSSADLGAIPADDRAVFEEGLRRGGSVLIADIAGDVDEAIRIIETFEPADLDHSTKTSSHQASAGAGTGTGVDVGAPLAAGLTAGMGQGNTNLESIAGMGAMSGDTSTLGTADLRTDEMSTGDQGRSTVAVGDRRSEERAGAPGVRELRGRVRTYGS